MEIRTVRDLQDLIQGSPRLAPLFEEVERRLGQADFQDPGHDLAHFLRVALWTLKLGGSQIDPECAVAAALLHDVVNLPKNHPDRARASELSAEVSREILPKLGFERAEVDSISDAVRDHSFSRGVKPQSFLGQALQDADRLESLGSIGLMRVFSTGALMGSRYFHSEDPWAMGRDRDDQSFSVDHFFTKLFKLPETMNTTRGLKEAQKRAQVLRSFLQQLGEELGQPIHLPTEEQAQVSAPDLDV